MDSLSYFATQSPTTDPGVLDRLFADLPRTVPELVNVVQGLCLAYWERYKHPIPNERLLETNSRYVETILERIAALDKRPLTETRQPHKRFMASCSDFANLLCAMLRFQGIPARKRVGFATYFTAVRPGFFRSHEIVEYWDSGAGRWRKVDPCLDEVEIAANAITFDPHDLPADRFIPAGMAWQTCRKKQSDPDKFGNEESRGFGVVLANLILDLAAMNKRELLNWDRFGWMEQPFATLGEEAWAILDRLAALLQAGNGAFADLQTLYAQEAGLQVPKVIWCDTPLTPPCKIELRE
ncbi:MAG: transglutaminase-like domain-containing protein [Candidatus Accumulibacter sp.]|nr:transglutaminase-like domain-containing protein [Accumulibacter sp.]